LAAVDYSIGPAGWSGTAITLSSLIELDGPKPGISERSKTKNLFTTHDRGISVQGQSALYRILDQSNIVF
jgi:hypothetical protein